MPNLDYNTSIKFLFWISESQGESMKNQEYLADDCKKDKELFNSSYYFYSSSFLCCSRGEKRKLYCF